MGLKAVLLRWLGGAEPQMAHQEARSGPIPVPPDQDEGGESNDDQEARLERLVSEFALLRMEWAEVLDKITAWANRQAARDRVAFRKALGDRPPGEDDQGAAAIEADAVTAANGVEIPRPVPGQHPKAALYAQLRRR
jgi:hypothetical protein